MRKVDARGAKGWPQGQPLLLTSLLLTARRLRLESHQGLSLPLWPKAMPQHHSFCRQTLGTNARSRRSTDNFLRPNWVRWWQRRAGANGGNKPTRGETEVREKRAALESLKKLCWMMQADVADSGCSCEARPFPPGLRRETNIRLCFITGATVCCKTLLTTFIACFRLSHSTLRAWGCHVRAGMSVYDSLQALLGHTQAPYLGEVRLWKKKCEGILWLKLTIH